MQDRSAPLTGKTVLITGAARRIGAQIVRALHGAGMNVVLHYGRSREEARALAGELQGRRRGSIALARANLRQTDSLWKLVETAAGVWGQLDVLINNAAVFYPTEIGAIGDSDWNDVMDTNLKAPLLLSQAAAPWLRAQRGCIINIVDIHGQRPLKGYPLYCLSKAGLAMLTQSLARELGPEVRVNGISPSAILWPEAQENALDHDEIIDRTVLKREGKPRDIANAVLYLIKDADYTTGQIIAVDGGRALGN